MIKYFVGILMMLLMAVLSFTFYPSDTKVSEIMNGYKTTIHYTHQSAASVPEVSTVVEQIESSINAGSSNNPLVLYFPAYDKINNAVRVTYRTGWKGGYPGHRGVDIAPKYAVSRANQNSSNTEIYSATPGIVTNKGMGAIDWTYGGLVEIKDTRSGIVYRYAHMRKLSDSIKIGDTVEAGEFLGLMGMEGNGTGVHLHWEAIITNAHPSVKSQLASHSSGGLSDALSEPFKFLNSSKPSGGVLNSGGTAEYSSINWVDGVEGE